MNKNKLKAYAPQARKDFIAAVTARANLLGLSEKSGVLEVAVGERKGDIAIIAGREWPVKVYNQREDLIKRMKNEGFSHTVEAVAYTWFNRFAALRYMEIHDYLDHGYRVLSNLEGGMPEILNHAAELDLPGLNKAKAIELKLAGNKDNDLYKLILVAQCNALSNAMPFLFERIDDETELLLPDNLLLTDSVIARLITEIPEEDWQEVEIIGWLYQFYISEKKDEVIGKVVKSEDIPAATQLFTPNWIVQYLVQNSVGRLWMMANPSSTLKSQWPYYIEPAEQTPEAQAQLNSLIQARINEDGGSLNPETIKVLDPACGSGHILVVAYDVLKSIYLERGYQPRAIPRLILEKNLYGLDIDDRAAQMAAFALLMKARADDRRLFTTTDGAGKLQAPKLNVLSLQESKGMQLDQLILQLQPYGVEQAHLTGLLEIFSHAKSYGSLIQIPKKLNTVLGALAINLQQAAQKGDLYAQAAAQDLLPLIAQSKLLAMQFDAVVANPPYMGSKGMNAELKDFAKGAFPDSKLDLFAMFMERSFDWCKASGFSSMITMQSWMFLSSYEAMREKLLGDRTIITMAHLGARAFSEISGEVVQTTVFVFQSKYVKGFKPVFLRLIEGNEEDKRVLLTSGQNRFDAIVQDEFDKIPGRPIPYWVTKKTIDLLTNTTPLEKTCKPRTGLNTGDNAKYIRYWHELDFGEILFNISSENEAVESDGKWFPYNKGGSFRKWYGNNELVINWLHNGEEIKKFAVIRNSGKHWSRFIQNTEFFFKEGLTWSFISSSGFGVRYKPSGFIFDVGGTSAFPSSDKLHYCAALLCSVVTQHFLKALNPTLNYQAGNISSIPFVYNKDISLVVENNALSAINFSKLDWDLNENSWDFKSFYLTNLHNVKLLQSSWNYFAKHAEERRISLSAIEKENNRLFIDAYGLQDELSPEVADDQLTLNRGEREKDCQRLISYAIGCMMGRYSLDEPGLIYAHAGNIGFDSSRYKTFLADADGIVPITNELWFEDDAANRIREFLSVVWSAETLDENITWLAESLGNKGNETPEETTRRFLASSFYKNHLQTYKKRPIYWLFSSGKQGAFQALVYLHRYNEGTLARMRSEYVVPLTGKMLSRIEMLEKDAVSADSTAARAKINKEIEVLRKQHIELLAYDEKLRHYADMRIQLDLDDGVKVNYGKFGDLLVEVKAVTGGASDE